ncbi:MAG: GNAT family N-acetyltransferase [Rhodobacteraceae bacterium]|nr:GNAT family N-acetyltransferase [Paracoccaceae bacterium]
MRLTGRNGGGLAEITFRLAQAADHPALWSLMEPVFRAGDTYAVDPAISRDAALDFWCGGNHRAFVAEDGDGDEMLGTYYLCPNQGGGGAHVANCGFVTAQAAQGRGVARAMLAHALDQARAAGFRAMQFNFVVESNTRAIALWQAHGFDVVGRLPGAFHHPQKGDIDALVMYRRL